MRRVLVAAALILILTTGASYGQNFSGTYVLKAQGATLTLSLSQDAQENIQGSLSSTAGVRYQVEGKVQEGVAVGTCYDKQGGVYFEGRLQGNQLSFGMIEAGANGMPDYNKVKQIMFVRQGGGVLPGPQAGAGSQGPVAGGIGGTQGAPGASQGTGSSQLTGQEVSDPNWGFKFGLPKGWKVQKGTKAVILGHDTVVGMIMVLPHRASNLQEVQSQMQEGLTEEGVQLLLSGGLKALGSNVIVGDYSGIVQGEQVKARGIGTLSPHGGGAYIIAIAVPEKFSRELSGTAETIVREMQYVKVEVSDLARHFTGTWTTMTSSTETQIVLRPDGSYLDTYTAAYSGQFSNQGGAWGYARDDHAQGRWTVRGNQREGVMLLRSSKGEERTVHYRVHAEKGQTYWNEYWFNGKLYGRRR